MVNNSATHSEARQHILSVLVENRPGVLARVTGLFARRSFNIDSLSVSSTERADISRITVTTDAEPEPLEQIIKQLNKLLHVLKIVELNPEQAVERELVLIKVKANERNRSDVLEIVKLFRVRVVDVHPESLTIEATGAQGKLDALMGLLTPFGMVELVRSGAVALTRGPKALSEKVPEIQIGERLNR
ncbi:acetolactate synthase small subunit [Bombiscardovia coagulans]|uniref:Acetolactate synthase small subunit n=1 Tax=Bombiscardovia coagulans TaxID=686666 RepID=A0A261EV10_9BIFI|nr:acetolactate synthase small subunit [Bombiscardovia coagulans]OZG50667.1 acetolactate synthase small subunit [Bombiscardovia coagulans]